ncbi:class I SAM-dependent methyltransferase [Limnohabitans sp.]|uniref:class I SAM-dependent methyltransferase n=1 Tax=Limnohabitans sp. TaxID=1907725 RepID=UPI0037BEFE23
MSNFHPPFELTSLIHQAIARAGGWIGFDRFMAMALYQPGLGYYTNALQKFGTMPSSGSDFVTAPGMSPLFGQTLAAQVRQALQATGSNEVWEFGAGTGALALQLLDNLGDAVRRYTIIDLSGTLRARQADTLLKHADKVGWRDAWPDAIEGVVLGNELLDAMPVQLLQRTQGVWHERGVVSVAEADGLGFAWQDRVTDLRPPVHIEGEHDYLTEIHPQAEAFIASLAERLLAGRGGAAFFLDYGFPEAEYFHPQRLMGTVMCHQLHQADGNPLVSVGQKDITAHVNFTGVALAAQNAGLQVLGYASQAWFLLNLGLAERMASANLAERSQAQRLINEHEMGELFKVVGFATSADWAAQGFAQGDRSHRL